MNILEGYYLPILSVTFFFLVLRLMLMYSRFLQRKACLQYKTEPITKIQFKTTVYVSLIINTTKVRSCYHYNVFKQKTMLS